MAVITDAPANEHPAVPRSQQETPQQPNDLLLLLHTEVSDHTAKNANNIRKALGLFQYAPHTNESGISISFKKHPYNKYTFQHDIDRELCQTLSCRKYTTQRVQYDIAL